MKAASRESSQPVAAAVEDEAVKRNTDCVYFLASPLTCKKGSECEYRHSEEARINPRDCWFWLNSGCLNPKCPFRHPPLEGLIGSSAATSAKPTLPPQPAPPTQLLAANSYAYNLGKQVTPCYYFQKGHCLKGDRCPYMHGPQPVDNSVLQPPVPKAQLVTEPQSLKKELGDFKKHTQLTKLPQTNVVKPVQVAPPAKTPTKATTAPVENGKFVEKVLLARTSFNDELPRYRPSNVSSVISGNSAVRPHCGRQTQPLDERSFRNGKEPDEFLRESSPGFDVLVDNDLQDADYYQNEGKFGRVTGHDGRHLNPLNEFNYIPSADYSSISKFDRETLTDSRGYEPYGRVKDQYDWEQCRASSERASGGSSLPERRGLVRTESPDQIDDSDLRYRLSKHRRISESRSAVGSDRRGDAYRRDDRGGHVEDQRYRAHSRRDSNNLLPHESSKNNRLQGRLSHFGRSSPEGNQDDSYPGREAERRSRGRLSPVRQPTSSYQGRLQDRLKRRVQEDFTSEGRSLRGSVIVRDEVDNNADFSAPKSLAELKSSKGFLSREDQRARSQEAPAPREPRNNRIGKLAGCQESESSLSFEGPKPLSEILKRKREEKGAASGNGMASSIVAGISQKGRDANRMAVSEKQNGMLSESKKEAENEALNSEEEPGSVFENNIGTVNEDEEGLISSEADEVVVNEGGPSELIKGSELETEDTMMLDKVDDQELESFNQQDGEYDYEQVDGGDLKNEDEENVEAEEEYLDDEDGDDFEKRIGILFS